MEILLLFWLSLHFDTGVELMKILLLFWLLLHFDTGVEDTWKFCCYSGTALLFDTGVRTHGNSVVIFAGTTLRYESRRLMEILLSF